MCKQKLGSGTKYCNNNNAKLRSIDLIDKNNNIQNKKDLDIKPSKKDSDIKLRENETNIINNENNKLRKE